MSTASSTTGPGLRVRLSLPLLLGLALAGATLSWAYWPTFVNMAERWSSDAQYSHGFLVPVFALVILWQRRDLRPRVQPAAAFWWGVSCLAVSGLLRFVSAYFYLEPLDAFSLLPALVGVCLLLGGWPALRWCWPSIAFLAFMLPLPHSVESALSQPLRQRATDWSTFWLQTTGYPALAEGNIIIIEEYRLGVIDACNGLGMLVTFFALATALALVSERPLVDRLILVASAIPIALIVNVARITLTGMAHFWFGEEIGRALMHDLAGWIMMPMALTLLWSELLFLKHLFIEVPVVEAQPTAGPLGPLQPGLQPMREHQNQVH